jgi:hypothetical protein
VTVYLFFFFFDIMIRPIPWLMITFIITKIENLNLMEAESNYIVFRQRQNDMFKEKPNRFISPRSRGGLCIEGPGGESINWTYYYYI